MRYSRSRDGRGGKRSRNRRYATTGPPPNSAAAGSEVELVRQPDADEEDEVVFLFSRHEPLYFTENKEKTLRVSYDRDTHTIEYMN